MRRLETYYSYGNSNPCIGEWLLYWKCPLFGVSVKRGSTVVLWEWDIEACPLFKGYVIEGSTVIIGRLAVTLFSLFF